MKYVCKNYSCLRVDEEEALKKFKYGKIDQMDMYNFQRLTSINRKKKI